MCAAGKVKLIDQTDQISAFNFLNDTWSTSCLMDFSDCYRFFEGKNLAIKDMEADIINFGSEMKRDLFDVDFGPI